MKRTLTVPVEICSNSIWKHQDKMWNMFKINNKDPRMRSFFPFTFFRNIFLIFMRNLLRNIIQKFIFTVYVTETSYFNSRNQLLKWLFWLWSCMLIDNMSFKLRLNKGNLRVRNYRTSRLEVFCKKSVPRNFVKFPGKHLCQNPFFNKVADLRPATLLKKKLCHRCFPVNFAKFLRKPFFKEQLSCFWN